MSDREEIDNAFIVLVATSRLFVHVFGDLFVVSYWIDTLVLKKLREILTLLCCITLSSSRENQRMLKR